MDIYLNGQLIQVPNYLTFQQLFQQSGIPGNINNKFWQRNGFTLLVNQNTCVNELLQPYDQLTLIDKPQKQGSNINQQQINFPNQGIGNQNLIQNQGIQQQKIIIQQNQYTPNPQFSIQQGGIQPQVFIKQGSQDNQQFYQNIQTNQYPIQNQFSQSQSINSQPQQNNYNNPQPQQNNYNNSQQQQNNYDIFQTVQDNNNQNTQDIFSTEYQYSNYETDRQNYLLNKINSPGDKQIQYVRDNYRFTIDNYGDDLIIEKLDQSFYLKINNKYKLNKVRQFDIVNKQKQFESNIIVDLNCTRVSWIQELDILAVQFNTGKVIALQIYLE